MSVGVESQQRFCRQVVLSKYLCVPKTRSGHNGDEARRGWDATTDRRIFVKGSVGASSVIVVRIREEHPAQMRLATDDDMVAMGLSRMPIARSRRCVTTEPKTRSRSRMRWRGAESHGKASVIWRAIQSAV